MGKAEQSTDTAKKYTVKRLRAICGPLFNVSGCAFDGAFFGRDGEYTLAEASGIIELWRKKKLGGNGK